MFMVSSRRDENDEDISGITVILGDEVGILPLRKSKIVTQCKICQAYGYTQKYRAQKPRFVRCIGKHLTTQEQLNTICPTAKYRRCMVAKVMQK